MRHYFNFLLLAFCAHLAGEEPFYPLTEVSGSGISSFNNPLEGIKAFTVLLPGWSNEPEKNFFIQELEKIGSVKTFSMSKAPINYEGMGTGMRLLLSIHELDVLDNPDLAIMRISLVLNTSVDIVKTKHPYEAHIWETNVFAMKENIMNGVRKILKPFVHFYKEANPKDKPIFYVYF